MNSPGAQEAFPQPFGKYQLLARIGSGGMAEVFRARLPGVAGFEKIVVIKRLLPHLARHPQMLEMFVNEAKLAAQVQHRNVVQVFELGQLENGEFFMAMEHVAGTDLRQLLRAAAMSSWRLPPWFSVHVVAEMLDGLAHAHELADEHGRPRNVVHRDVTPANIFLSYLGDIKLGDFGVAKDDSRSQQTRAGQLKGKVPYMSPEQLYGRELDARTDVFAAGVVLWECLTQRRLFGGRPDIEAMNLICYGERKPPSAFAPDVPPQLDQMVLGALEAQADRRIPSARVFRDLLLEVLAHLRPRVQPSDVKSVVESVVGNPATGVAPRPPPAEDPARSQFLDSTPGSAGRHGSGATPSESFSRELAARSGSLPGVLPTRSASGMSPLPSTSSFNQAPARSVSQAAPRAGSGVGPPPRTSSQAGQNPWAYQQHAPELTALPALPQLQVEPRAPAERPAPVVTDTYPRNLLGAATPEPMRVGYDLPFLDPVDDPLSSGGLESAVRQAAASVAVPEAVTNLVPKDGAVPGLDTRAPIARVSDLAHGAWKDHVLLSAPYEGPHPFWVEAHDGAVVGPLSHHDAVTILRYECQAGHVDRARISATQRGWMDVASYAVLTGQEILLDPFALKEKELPRSPISGSFQHTSATGLFARVSRERPTGRLIMYNPGLGQFVRREVEMVEGKPTFVYANSPDLQLPELLVKKKLLSRDQMAEMVYWVVVEDRPIEQVVAQRAGIDVARYWPAFMKERLVDVFRWSACRFAVDGAAPVSHTTPFAPTFLSLVPELIYRTKTQDDLRAAMSPYLERRLERSERFNQGVAEMRLSETQTQAVIPFGGKRTLAYSLKHGMKDERLNLMMAYVLVEAELLRPA